MAPTTPGRLLLQRRTGLSEVRLLGKGHDEHMKFNIERGRNARQPADRRVGLSGDNPKEVRPVDRGEVRQAVQTHLTLCREGADVRPEQPSCFRRIHA